MRKATGKVVSLVLALALVITSFSATFASAASTKTESASGTVDLGTIDLVNLNGVEDLDTARNTNNQDKYNLSDFVDDELIKLETYDHIMVPVTAADIQSVSISGDSIVRVAKTANAIGTFAEADDYVLTVRSATGVGEATVKILFSKTFSDREEESTIRGTATVKVKLYDAKTPSLQNVGNLPKNPVYADSDFQKDAESNKYLVSNDAAKKAQYALPTIDGDSAERVSWAAQKLVAYDEDSKTYTNPGINGTDTFYVVQVVGNDGYLKVEETNDNSFDYGILAPTVGKSVRVRLFAVKNTNTAQGEYTWELGSAVVTETVKIEDRIEAGSEAVIVELGDASTNNTVDLATGKVLSKSKTYVELHNVFFTVNSATEINTTGNLTVENGKVGDVEGATVTVNGGTVGNVVGTTVNVFGGTVKDIDGGAVEIDGGNAESISDATTVLVRNGKVSGAVKATSSVTVQPANDECTASVGAVTAPALTVDSTEAAASAASFTADNASSESDTFALHMVGKAATIGAIAADYRPLTILLDGFTGTISAPSDGYYTGWDHTGVEITTDTEGETKATVSGTVNVETIDLQSGSVTFTGNITVDYVEGLDADFVINAGALYIKKSIATSNVLKLADPASVKAGTLVFRAESDIASVDSFVPYGYELDVVSSKSYDGFVIKSTSFAGLTLDCGDTIELLVGEEVTVTASAYPAGTSLPEGLQIMFYLNDADLNYISGNNLGNGQATVKALKYDPEFDVLNTGKLVAVVVDEYEMTYEEYGEATATVKVVEKKTSTETYKSDTTGDVVVAKGNTYQFKITSLNGQTPSVVLGSDGVFELVGTSVEGSDYFFKFQAVGASGAATGVYVNGDAKVATLYVDGNTGYTCDTTTVNVPAGGTYQVKITAASMPTLLPGNSIYTVAFASQEGNDYFFKITATSAQAGDVVGFYINGGARAFVATTV